jgi:hypothetical protein
MSDSTNDQLIIYDSPFYKVLEEPSSHLAIVLFNGMPLSENYRKGIDLLLEHSKQDNILSWLILCRDGCKISIEDQHWTAAILKSKIASKLKLQKIAVIESIDFQDRVNLMSLAEIINSISQIDIQFFEKEINARAWLSSEDEFRE